MENFESEDDYVDICKDKTSASEYHYVKAPLNLSIEENSTSETTYETHPIELDEKMRHTYANPFRKPSEGPPQMPTRFLETTQIRFPSQSTKT